MNTEKSKLSVTFLGGVGEIGKNLTVIQYDDEMILVDCGLTFPGDELPGIDLVVPDFSYLEANKDKIKGLIVTHGHEDHIGGIPYLLQMLNMPIYGSKLSLALIENKLKEFPKIKAKMIAVKPKNLLKLSDKLSIEFIKVSHSIAGSLALAINTPEGTIIHTGDFKIDFQPIDGVMTDLTRLGELGKKGVLLLLCESTNVCKKGYSMSEAKVGETLDKLFEKFKEQRIFVASFASNIHRMQQVLNLAEKYKRKVAFTGRSMVNISETAMKLGELKYNKENIIEIDKIDKYADKELLILTTGSQGEPMSALSRIANNEFNKIKVGDNDAIIISASPIPGNEKSVYTIINKLFKKGADVVYDELAEVHASGHGCEEELKIMHALTKPKFFMPIHGEYRHLKRHKELAMTLGMNQRNIILPDLGLKVEVGKEYMKTSGYVPAGQKLIDGTGLGDMSSAVLKDRKQLAEDGFCIVVLNRNTNEKGDLYDPFIISRGFLYDTEVDKFNSEAKEQIMGVLHENDYLNKTPEEVRNIIKKFLSNLIMKQTKRKPIIIAIVIDNN